MNAPQQTQTTTYATTSDLNALKTTFIEQMDILSKEIKKLTKTQNTEE